MISSKAYKVVASGSTAAAALAAGAVVVKSERARRERGAAGGETRAGTVEATTGQTAVTSIAAATIARSFAAFSLRLLPITAAEVFPVVYAKEAEHIVVSSGAGGPSVVSPRDERSDRTDATESAIEGSSINKGTPGVHRSSDGGSGLEGGAESVKEPRKEGDAGENDDEEEDEETTCPFCLFQRRGPCGTQFRSWEKCIARAKKNDEDFVSKCAADTRFLMGCMDKHPEYYTIQEDAEDDQQDNATTPSNNEENSVAAAVAGDQETRVVDNLGASQ